MKKYRVVRVSSLNHMLPIIEHINYNKNFNTVDDAMKCAQDGYKGQYQHLIVEFDDAIPNDFGWLIEFVPKIKS